MSATNKPANCRNEQARQNLQNSAPQRKNGCMQTISDKLTGISHLTS